MNLEEKYLNIFFSNKYFAKKLTVVKNNKIINCIVNEQSVNSSFSDLSVDGFDVSLLIQTSSLMDSELLKNDLIDYNGDSYKVVKITRNNDFTTNLDLEKQ